MNKYFGCAFIVMMLASCGRERCYRCIEKTSYKEIIAPTISGDTVEKCGMTKHDIKKVEKDSRTDNGYTITELECSEE